MILPHSAHRRQTGFRAGNGSLVRLFKQLETISDFISFHPFTVPSLARNFGGPNTGQTKAPVERLKTLSVPASAAVTCEAFSEKQGRLQLAVSGSEIV